MALFICGFEVLSAVTLSQSLLQSFAQTPTGSPDAYVQIANRLEDRGPTLPITHNVLRRADQLGYIL